MLNSPLVKLAAVGAALYFAHKYGNQPVKVAAVALAATVVVNQVPLVRDALNTRLAA